MSPMYNLQVIRRKLKNLAKPSLVLMSLELYSPVKRRNRLIVDQFVISDHFGMILWINPSSKPFSSRAKRIDMENPKLIVFTPLKLFPEYFKRLKSVSLFIQLYFIIYFLSLNRIYFWINNLEWYAIAKKKRRFLYDVTDDWTTEPTIDKVILNQRVECESQLLKRASVVTVCSTELALRKNPLRNDIRFEVIPNGAAKLKFQEIQKHSNMSQNNFRDSAIYIGTLHESRLDISLVCRLSDFLHSNGGYSVILLGPNHLTIESIEKLRSHSVRLMSALPHDSIPEIMEKSGAIIIPHLDNSFTQSLDPLKFYESLCSTTPTISTNFANVSTFSNEINIASYDDFPTKVLRILQTRSRRVPTWKGVRDWREVSEEFLACLSKIESQ